jgi:hypothetical protein
MKGSAKKFAAEELWVTVRLRGRAMSLGRVFV